MSSSSQTGTTRAHPLTMSELHEGLALASHLGRAKNEQVEISHELAEPLWKAGKATGQRPQPAMVNALRWTSSSTLNSASSFL